MFGFLIGFACLWGLIRVVRGGRRFGGWGVRRGYAGCGGYGGYGGYSGHHGPGGGWGDDDFGGWPRRRRRGNAVMRGLFSRLDTTPGQEKEIGAAFDDVMDAGRALKDDVKGSKKDVAEAFRSDDFNAELMASLLTRHDASIDKMRQAVVSGLARVHATLDADQRKALSRMLERGPGWGPYR